MNRKNLLFNSCIIAMLALAFNAFGQDADDTDAADDSATADQAVDSVDADQAADTTSADQAADSADADQDADTTGADQAADSADAVPAPAAQSVPMQTRSASTNNASDYDVGLTVDGTTCTFTGGSDGAGNVTVTKRNGEKKITISLDDKKAFTISNVTFTNNEGGQVSLDTKDKKKADLKNKNTALADIKYSVIVYADSAPTVPIDCDPRIINK